MKVLQVFGAIHLFFPQKLEENRKLENRVETTGNSNSCCNVFQDGKEKKFIIIHNIVISCGRIHTQRFGENDRKTLVFTSCFPVFFAETLSLN